MRWGTEKGLGSLFGGEVTIGSERRTVTLRQHRPADAVSFFRTHFGPVHQAFEALDEERRDALATDLEDLVARANVSTDDTVVAPFEYLEAVLALP